jgi:hypothetical protein
MQVLDQREEGLLNQVRGIRFALGKTNSKLVKRPVKTVNNWRQVRRSDEFAFVLINRLFGAFFLDESLSYARPYRKSRLSDSWEETPLMMPRNRTQRLPRQVICK